MTSRRIELSLGLSMALILACGRSSEPSFTTTSEAVPDPAPLPEVMAVQTTAPQKLKVEFDSEARVRREPPTEDLQAEEREENPNSEHVILTLNVNPPVKAVVLWGAKQVGKLTPNNGTLELKRPRASGPVDLEIRAEGFLTHHTRLYSNRNDKVNVRLVRVADAPSLFGYRISAAAAKARK